MERLQKIISKAGVASRRAAEQLIVNGKVSVNGKITTELGVKVDPGKDKISVNGETLASEKKVYVLLFKPRGVVTSLSDPQGRKNIANYVTDISERIYPVGRLDYNTDGLLLLTNDGELTHALTHPSKEITKTYLAVVQGIPPEEKLDRLRAGIKLEDGVTASARLDIAAVDHEKNETTVKISIHEGKNRQIRRMFEAIGHAVKQLRRTQFAFLTLEGLKRGQYRHLTPDEVKSLKQLIPSKATEK